MTSTAPTQRSDERRYWYDAAAYCNWLSRKEKLPECYEPNEDGKYAAGMKIKPDALKLSVATGSHRGGMGVRLPSGGGDQPLLRGEMRPAGAVCPVLCHVSGPRLGLWQPAAQRPWACSTCWATCTNGVRRFPGFTNPTAPGEHRNINKSIYNG